MKHIHLKETESTNAFLRNYTPDEGEDITVVSTDYQTMGKGQGKNTWESKPGENLLFSILCHPKGVPAKRQFIISQAIALAIRDALRHYIGDVEIKWPNDIYWHDRKLGGILIECSLSRGEVKDCIIGVGIDVNQQVFDNLTKNPISIFQIIHREIDRDELMKSIVDEFQHYLNMIECHYYDLIAQAYMLSLYRRKGFHTYTDANGLFLARFVTVEPTGHLVLKDDDGMFRVYAFKEVKYEIEGKTFLRGTTKI